MSSYPCRSTKKPGRSARALGDIVTGVLKDLGGKGRLTEEDMCEAWRRSAGDRAAKHSRPVSLRGGTIFINVDRSSWLHELTVRKKELVVSLGETVQGKKIRDIRFRIGEIAVKKE